MLYQFFSWLDKSFNLPGTGMFQFLTFRIAMAILLSLFIATVYGKKMILFLQKKQIGESVRELGLAGEQQKKGTPTMGGIIILIAGKGHEKYQDIKGVKSDFDDKQILQNIFNSFAK